MNPIVSIRNLYKEIGGRVILEDINLEVYEGEVFSIVGGSGSGKTSITKCIVGLWKPTKGVVEVFGKNLSELSFRELDEIRRYIGYVFQESALFDSLTVWENVTFYFLERMDTPEEELKSLALEKLRLVGLDESVLNLYPSELSGGMKKRVGVARAIATDPKLIIYDEPTSGLDPITSRMIDELILSLREKVGSTSIVVTHDLITAFTISDRMAVVDKGRLIQVGTPREIMESDNPLVRDFVSKGLIQNFVK